MCASRSMMLHVASAIAALTFVVVDAVSLRVLKGAGSGGKIEVNIIGLQPYSGEHGDVGPRIEPMIQVALDHVEARTNFLSNHSLVFHMVDSSCSLNVATDRLFTAHIETPSKFGIFGSVCADACIAANVVSRNFKTAHFGQLCEDAVMSNNEVYPFFARFLPDLDKHNAAAIEFISIFGWKKIGFVMEPSGIYVDMSQRMEERMKQAAIEMLTKLELLPHAWKQHEMKDKFAETVVSLATSKARIILFIGADEHLAGMLCAAFDRQFLGNSVVYITPASRSESNWYETYASQETCLSENLRAAGQGLFRIDVLRAAPDEEGPHDGSGKLPSEVMSAYHALCKASDNPRFESFYRGPKCDDWKSAYTYDAVWGWAFTLDRWLSEGHSIDEINYADDNGVHSFYETEVEHQDFFGITGRVRHYEHGDRDGRLEVRQFLGTEFVLQAIVYDRGQLQWKVGAKIYWGGDENSPFDPTLLGKSDEQWAPGDSPMTCPAPLYLFFDVEALVTSERCLPCPGGTQYYPGASGSSGSCIRCNPGLWRAATFTSSQCELCPQGTFSIESGAQVCDPCPAGHVCKAGTAVPVECEVGNYAPAGFNDTVCMQCAPGRYANESATVSCKHCQAILDGSSSQTAARSPDNCLCPIDKRRVRDKCVECPEGISCPTLGGTPLVQPYFYITPETSVSDANIEVWKCMSAEACPGQKKAGDPICGPLHDKTVINCGPCQDHHREVFGKCIKCPDGALPLVLGAVLSLAAFGILYGLLVLESGKDSRGKSLLASVVSIFGFFAQILGMFSRLKVDWPNTMRNLWNFFSFFMFDVSGSRLSCYVPSTLAAQYLTRLGVLVLVPAYAAVWFAFHHIVKLLFGDRVKPPRSSVLFGTVGSIAEVLTISILSTIVSLYECYESPNSKHTIRTYPSVVCGSDEHNAMVLFMIIALFGVIAYLSIFCYLLVRAPDCCHDEHFAESIRFLTKKYHYQCFWYSIPCLIRAILVAMVTVVEPDDSFIQLFLLQVIISIFLAVSLHFRPYENRMANYIEYGTSLLLLSMICMSFYYSDSGIGQNNKTGESLNVILFCLIAYALFGFTFKMEFLIRHKFADNEAISQTSYVASRLIPLLKAISFIVLAEDTDNIASIIGKASHIDHTHITETHNFLQLECLGMQAGRFSKQRLPKFTQVIVKESFRESIEQSEEQEACDEPRSIECVNYWDGSSFALDSFSSLPKCHFEETADSDNEDKVVEMYEQACL